MKIPPEIYLQVFDDDGDEIDDKTWCDDKIYVSDIKYIRHDMAIFYNGEKE